MTNYTFNNTDDTQDVRDIIARFEELENALVERFNEQQGIEKAEENEEAHEAADSEDGHFKEWLKQTRADDEEATEFNSLKALLEELKGNGGDEQWRGDWYPVTLIRNSYFADAMDELLEDCGDMKPFDKMPSYLTITVDYKALRMDYMSVEIDDVTYWYR